MSAEISSQAALVKHPGHIPNPDVHLEIHSGNRPAKESKPYFLASISIILKLVHGFDGFPKVLRFVVGVYPLGCHD